MPYECARCGAESAVLFCADCAPVDEIVQAATVHVGDAGYVEIRTKHRPAPDRKPAREVTVTEKFNHDRQRVERRTIYIDRVDRLYIEVWQDLDTGEVCYQRRADLDDQTHHGPRTRAQQQGRRGKH